LHITESLDLNLAHESPGVDSSEYHITNRQINEIRVLFYNNDSDNPRVRSIHLIHAIPSSKP